MANMPDPEPGEEFIEPKCGKCGNYMVSQRQWRAADRVERAELREEGYRVQRRVGICRLCSPEPKK